MSLPNEKMVEKNYNVHLVDGKIIKLWNKHVTIEEAAMKQLGEVASIKNRAGPPMRRVVSGASGMFSSICICTGVS